MGALAPPTASAPNRRLVLDEKNKPKVRRHRTICLCSPSECFGHVCLWHKCEVPEVRFRAAVGVIADVTQTSFEDRC